MLATSRMAVVGSAAGSLGCLSSRNRRRPGGELPGCQRRTTWPSRSGAGRSGDGCTNRARRHPGCYSCRTLLAGALCVVPRDDNGSGGGASRPGARRIQLALPWRAHEPERTQVPARRRAGRALRSPGKRMVRVEAVPQHPTGPSTPLDCPRFRPCAILPRRLRPGRCVPAFRSRNEPFQARRGQP